jgi:hypothetical protein
MESASSSSTEEMVAIPSYAPSAPAPLALELPRAVESPVDDPRLANPLARMERMSTGWMGVRFGRESCFCFSRGTDWGETQKRAADSGQASPGRADVVAPRPTSRGSGGGGVLTRRVTGSAAPHLA